MNDQKEEKFYDCDCEPESVPLVFQDAVEEPVATVDDVNPDPDPGQSASQPDEFAVDDVHLKELEELMNEEEKQNHHKRALDIKKEGNASFVEQRWEDAARIYTKALVECPPSFAEIRAILYSNRAACFIKMDQTEKAITDCSKSIELDPNYAKAYHRRAQLYETKEETWDKALEDYEKSLRLQADNAAARAALMRLPSMIAERNERMKADMINKLKDLGNMFLRPFGLSTENFKMEQSPEGGYSVKIKK